MEFAVENVQEVAKNLPTYVKHDMAESKADDQPSGLSGPSISPRQEPGSQTQSQGGAEDEEIPPFYEERKNIEMLHGLLEMTHETVKHDTSRLAVQVSATFSS